MFNLYRVIRAVLITALVLAVVLPAALYIALSLPMVQNYLRHIAEEKISEVIDADVTIGMLDVEPFNQVKLGDVVVVCRGDTVMKVRHVDAAVNLYHTIFKGKTVVNYAGVIGLDTRISRDSVGAPLNIQPIIDRLSKSDDDKPSRQRPLRINTLVVRDSRLSYDIADAPERPDEFDMSHIAITDLNINAIVPDISDGAFEADLMHMSFVERSGLTVTDLHAEVDIDEAGLAWHDLRVEMPRSLISFADLRVSAIDYLSGSLLKDGIDVGILPGSHVYLPDIKPLTPLLGSFDATVDASLDAEVRRDGVTVRTLDLADDTGLLSMRIDNGTVLNPLDVDSLSYSFDNFHLYVGPRLLAELPRLMPAAAGMPYLPAGITFTSSAHGTLLEGVINGSASAGGGSIAFAANYRRASSKSPLSVNFTLDADNFDLATPLRRDDFGAINAHVAAAMTMAAGRVSGSVDARITDFRYRTHVYDYITASAKYADGRFSGRADMVDDAGRVDLSFDGSTVAGEQALNTSVSLAEIDLHKMALTDKLEGYTMSADITADLARQLPSRASGVVRLTDIVLTNPEGRQLSVDSIVMISDAATNPRSISIDSDLLDAEIVGDFDFVSLPGVLERAFLSALPTLSGVTDRVKVFQKAKSADDAVNRFDFTINVTDTDALADFFGWTTNVVYPISINGYVDSSADFVQLSVDAPFIQHKGKLIEDTAVEFVGNGSDGFNRLYFTTRFPSKQGPITLLGDVNASDDRLNTIVNFNIDRATTFGGTLAMTSQVSRDDDDKIMTVTDVHRSNLTLNDSVWTVHPATITAYGTDSIVVGDFNISRANQFIKASGTVSTSPDDMVKVDILNLNLDYIFESLGIEQCMLGGDATGTIVGASLLSESPYIATDGLAVENISYNKSVLGQGLVKIHWDGDDRAIVFDGNVTGREGNVSDVLVRLYAFDSALDLRVDADRIPLGLLGKYFKAFASDVDGIGSGWLHVWGTFKDVDMEGVVRADSLGMRVNYTNCAYHVADSCVITPGRIDVGKVRVYDRYGRSALLYGSLTHNHFRDMCYDFHIDEVDRMLVYDQPRQQDVDWYGHVFASGEASIKGDPEMINIAMNMTTNAGSTFNYMLSDREIADEYTFLTFRDPVKEAAAAAQIVEVDERMERINRLRRKADSNDNSHGADYVIDMTVGINPDATINLIMNPSAGDRITSNGRGSVHLRYASADNDVSMRGSYILDVGKYNFTLQDIIIKDFNIEKGSEIIFVGDPMATRLDITATHEVYANLSDLDESFLSDKDLSRTNVPVQTVLHITGDINTPELNFDLAFPTISADTERKVRSILSTEEMLNRQIIYLLALNRFYTPDYMGSTTKGNELFSVASSTLTSQLSNILGHLSDKWAIAPNLRSDRGDFSDVEVDVALSSRLLNNRLLLNGNFGYRDPSLNTNQFIGDFDIEYLLNRMGTVRLKAYSHYNDQNYYLRQALTTQGVGVMLRYDFDGMFDWLGFLRKKRSR